MQTAPVGASEGVATFFQQVGLGSRVSGTTHGKLGRTTSPLLLTVVRWLLCV